MSERPRIRFWWCRSCGLVATSDEAPICRHFVVDGPPVTRMERLPSYHPFAKELAGAEGPADPAGSEGVGG